MTDQQIQKQIEAIKSVTEKALQSKEASRKILIDAGIIKPMTIFEYLEALIFASDSMKVKPVIISIMLEEEHFQLAIDQISKMESSAERRILDNPEERGVFLEYCTYIFRIYKSQ